jgi:hypothetical protein
LRPISPIPSKRKNEKKDVQTPNTKFLEIENRLKNILQRYNNQNGIVLAYKLKHQPPEQNREPICL